ncbi:MAG: glutaminyl-peptide cyclotransferase [Syntrophobacteraceae bacterium]
MAMFRRRNRPVHWLVLFPLFVCTIFCTKQTLAAPVSTASASCAPLHLAPSIPFTILREYPHDPRAFTEGLLFANGFLYESTGLNGESTLRKVDLKTGRVLKVYDLPAKYFGEGLALWGGSLFQLTWHAGIAFQYSLHGFSPERRFRYYGEGWGLTADKKSLIMSNGSSEILFLDPATFAVKRTLSVLDMGRPVRLLNELEYIKGKIFANVWHDDQIAVISPKTGEVTGWIDLSSLRRELPPTAIDLNGIAYDAQNDTILVTGKLWPLLFEIRPGQD